MYREIKGKIFNSVKKETRRLFILGLSYSNKSLTTELIECLFLSPSKKAKLSSLSLSNKNPFETDYANEFVYIIFPKTETSIRRDSWIELNLWLFKCK